MSTETRDARHETRFKRVTCRVARLASGWPHVPFAATIPAILGSRRVSIAGIAAAVLTLSGCSIEPWVKPYERAALADPIMAAARDAVAAEYLHHVHEVREGARGASGSAGGGCGCN